MWPIEHTRECVLQLNKSQQTVNVNYTQKIVMLMNKVCLQEFQV